MSLQQTTPYIVDGKGHLLGRLASIIAKQILSGQKVTVVRAELVNVSGNFFRNKVCLARLVHANHSSSTLPSCTSVTW